MAVNDFKVTRERRVFLNDREIEGVLGFDIVINATDNPIVSLRLSCGSVAIDEYTDVYHATKEPRE